MVVGKDLWTERKAKDTDFSELRSHTRSRVQFQGAGDRRMETGLGALKVTPAPLVLPGHSRGQPPSWCGRKSRAPFLRRRGPNVFCGPEDFL